MTNAKAYATPTPDVPRDRWGRPMILPPDGSGKLTGYTRTTTYIGVLEDLYGVQQWEKRLVATALVEHPDLRTAFAGAVATGDKKAQDRVVADAKERAGGSAAATRGTALHALTEGYDRTGVIPTGLEDDVAADVAGYVAATKGFEWAHIEAMTVLDTLQVAGTPDRILRIPKGADSGVYIGDLKTGKSIELGTLKIAMQLAVYSRSWLYDPSTGARTVHGASTTRGLIFHAPAGVGTTKVHWVDLTAGWEAVKVATAVRAQRKLKYADLVKEFGDATTTPPETVAAVEVADWRLGRGAEIADAIARATTVEELRAAWRPEWPQVAQDAAKRRAVELGGAS